MEIKVSLPAFVEYLIRVKSNNRQWAHIDEIGWLLSSFQFTDSEAIYVPDAPGIHTSWFHGIARN